MVTVVFYKSEPLIKLTKPQLCLVCRKNMNYQAVLQRYNQISSLLCYRVPDRDEPCVLCTCKVARGKWEVGVNRRNGKCVTNAASTTDWPHCIASL